MRRAATALLLRERRSRLEVLMLRRHPELRVLGGAWVFPGGVVDDEDGDPELLGGIAPELRARSARRLAQPPSDPLPEPEATAIHVAACRETLEEAGVLLALRADGGALEPGQLAEALALRHDFPAALRALELVPDVGRLLFWSHWITPSAVAARFDTRFFVAALPGGQTPAPDAREMTEARWLEPREEIPDVPAPTRMSLLDLADAYRRHGSLDALLAAEAERPVPPVLPRVAPPEETHAVYPWDRHYPELPGEGVELAEVPAHLARLPSRLPRTSPTLGRG
jgi:8-oxo-dGTP pyrophosphatase MutT (NUDIX family)